MALTRRQLVLAVGLPLSYIIWGYLTYYLPRIHLLPYAFLAGVLTTVLTLSALIALTVRPRTYDEIDHRRWRSEGYNKLHQESNRAAFTKNPDSWQESVAWLAGTREYRRKSLWPTNPTISEKVDEILGWIYRDFVGSWYGNISKSPTFVNEIDRAIKGAVWTIRGRLEEQDLIKSGVQRIVPLFTNHVRLFNEAEISVRGRDLSKVVTESEELDLAIAGKYGGSSAGGGVARLHPAASLTFSDLKTVQQEYVRRLVRKILPKVLPAYFVESKAVCVMVEEIVSCAIIVPAMQMASDPDTWNQIMEAYGRTVLQDRKSVQKLRKALDEHASPVVAQKTAPRTFPRLSPDDDERKFERYVRAVRKCNDLSEARRFRSEVASQLKRAIDAGVSDQVYVRRLETSKRLLDQRVGLLSSVGASSQATTTPTKKPEQPSASRMRIQDVLYNPAGLSYFMEYMDRIGLMALVQFYIVVDGFRTPLEDDFIEDHKVAESSLKWSDSDKQDIAQINQAYLSRLELRVPSSSKEAVRHFLKAGKRATPVQYQRARSAILRAQTSVFEEMRDKYFKGFQDSDLWYKFVTSEDAAASTTRASATAAASRILDGPSMTGHIDSARSSIDAPHMARSKTSDALKADSADLKRNTHSVGNFDSFQKRNATPGSPVRRISLDVDPSRPLFDDDVEPEAMGESIASLDDYDELTPAIPPKDDPKVVDAMQAALDDIITHEDQEAERPQDNVAPVDRGLLFGDEPYSGRSSGEIIRAGSPIPGKARGKRNLASLGLVNTSSRVGVFKDNDLFGDEPKLRADETEEPPTPGEEKEEHDEILRAAPGDLGLAEAITALTTDIDKLVAQENIVDTLNRKAELTNNVAELRILRKSKESLQREIHRKELQRQQYIVQESDNSLFGRANVHIKSVVVGKEPDGQEFALYVVEVRRQAGEQMPAASWAIARRYSEFHELHQRLRNIYPAVRELEFPRRRLMMKLQRDFLHKRRISLENYLQDLLRMPEVCKSRDLRAFLSQSAIISADSQADGESSRADIVSRIYNSVTDGMDEFLGNIPVLDQLTAAGQNLISAATSQYYENTANPAGGGGGVDGPALAIDPRAIGNGEILQTNEAQAELEAFEGSGTAQAAALQPFVSPISDLFLEVFELNRSSNASWLRGRAVVVVLHQLLGGTVERKMRDVASQLMGEKSILKYVDSIKTALWKEDGSGLKRDRVPRTKAQKKTSRKEASVTLAALVPELAGNVVGRDNAKRAARKMFAATNNERLNVHLAFRVLDELVCMVWPEMAADVGRM